MTDEKQCGQCRHWHKCPPDPNNLGAVNGTCRWGPPQIGFANTPQGPVQVSLYPTLPAGFAACAQFAPALQLTE